MNQGETIPVCDPMKAMTDLQEKFCRLSRTPKLLIVEDDFRYVQLLQNWFLTLNYWATFCLTAESALESVLVNEFDVVWLDLNLPGMSGIDLIRALQETSQNPPIIVVSDLHQEHQFIKEAVSLGVVFIHGKPDNLEKLKTLLKTINPR